ncbi:MAG: AraC family transcriptional regulator [Mariniphaga sp.]
MQHILNSNIRYLPVHEQDENWSLIVRTAGFQSILPNSIYPTEGHSLNYSFNYQNGRVLDEFQLIYITKGSGIFESTGFKSVSIVEGTIFFLFPGEWHRFRPEQATGWDSYWIGFKGKFAENLVANGYLSVSKPVVKVGYNEEIVSLYRRILEAGNEERAGYQQYISGIVIHLLGYIYYRAKDNQYEDKAIVQKIDKARVLIREQINENISPEVIAKELVMTYSWFRRLFRQYTGLAPAQYIAQLRLQRAKELLSTTLKSVKEIAVEMNYESVDYFSTQFKRQTKMTPTQYRRSCSGK